MNDLTFKHLMAILLLSLPSILVKGQVDAPRPEFRRSDWMNKIPNGPTITRENSGEDWWYGHCNAYKNGEFIGYMGAGFSRPEGYYPDGLPGDCMQYQNTPTSERDCQGAVYSTVGLIDKSGAFKHFIKHINYAHEELFNVIQLTDGTFVTVGKANGTRDDNGNPMVYNPKIGQSAITFPNNFVCNLDENDYPIESHLGFVIRFDIEGNIIWQYIYGKYEPLNSSNQELQNAYYSKSTAYDLMEVNENRIRIVGTDYSTGSGGYNNYTGYIMDIDLNGNILNRYSLPNTRYNYGSSLLGIKKIESETEDKFVIGGSALYQSILSTSFLGCGIFGTVYVSGQYAIAMRAMADVYTFNNGTYNASWVTPFYNNGGFYNNNHVKSFDVDVNISGDILLPSLAWTEGCVEFSGVNKANGTIHRLSQTDGSILSISSIGECAAFDLKMGITATADNGFAVVSTKSITAPFNTSELDLTNTCYSVDRQYRQEMTNTDAYVAKFDANGDMVWETTFNVTDADPVISTPENPKQQECMYKITECPEDKGLVISGNNSYNMDDFYLAKLHSDCSLFTTYDIDGDNDSPYTVFADEVWNSSKKIRGPVLIIPGVTLTITGANTVIEFADSRVRLNDGTRIEVEAGGRLIVDGAMLTSLQNCPNSIWSGIVVHGIPTENQDWLQGGYNVQGLCRLQNNATISNAEDAIRLWNPFKWNAAGGIVQAKNANFINNSRSVEFISYHNFNNQNQEINNVSSFIGCRFENDRMFGNNLYPRHMVTMWDVFGVTYRGCEFINSLDENKTDPNFWAEGILSLDAGYFVDKFCEYTNPNGDCLGTQYNSEFKRLKQGIFAMNVEENYAISVSRTLFDGNFQGVRLDASNHALIVNNIFEQGGFPSDQLSKQTGYDFGVYSLNSTQFTIENNTFRNNINPSLRKSLGTYISESGPAENQIFKNTYRNLKVANYAQGQNRQFQGGNNANLQGLKYFCNDMNNTNASSPADIYINPNTTGPANEQGIARTQGVGFDNPFTAAGNKFTPDCDLINARHIENLTNLNIRYYFNNSDPLQIPDLNCSSNITPFVASSNQCKSSFDDGKTKKMLSQDEREQLEADYELHRQEADAISTMLNQSIDNGNTEMLNNYIEAVAASQSSFAFSELMNNSPYLSKEALEKSVERNDVFSASQLYNLLIANPDGINTDDFLTALADSDVQFPQWMLDNIQNSQQLVTLRTILETAASYHYALAQSAARNLLQDALFDTLGHDKIRIKEWLQNEQDFIVDLQRHQYAVRSNELGEAQQIWAELDSKYNLEKAQNLDEHKQDYNMLKEALTASRNESRKLNSLNEEEVSILRSIAESDKSGGRYASNILRFFYVYEEQEAWIPLQHYAKKMPSKSKLLTQTESLMRVFPNPALSEFSIALNELNQEKFQLEVYNAQGKMIENTIFSAMTTISCGSWAKGIYLLKIYNSEKHLIQTDKIIIQ